jgi:hypothetical protein
MFVIAKKESRTLVNKTMGRARSKISMENLNSNPGGYIKRTMTDGIKFILTSVSEERGGGKWTLMCRFYFYELIWSVYLYLMCLCCEMHRFKI